MTIDAQEQHTLSVSQLTNAIKLCLEQTFPKICVQGEISNFKKQSSGHLYFSIKDEQSQISAVMFRGQASQLSTLPKDGDKVIIEGEINVYPPSGKYQILVKSLRLVGLGELLLKLEELKKKIHALGWFSTKHKKKIPKLPKCIGVVTSPTGAAIQDILNVLTRRFSGFRLILNPVRVQGAGAAQEIAQAIKDFNTYDLVDVMIVGRGGGSIEDLWAFNEEIVAEAIFNSRIPIVAAVGHESDHCIAEYVADIRAPTPSAAAEIVMAEKTQQQQHLLQLEKRLDYALSQMLRHYRQKLTTILRHPLFSSPYYLLGPWLQKLDDLKDGIDQNLYRKVNILKGLLEARGNHVRSMNPAKQIVHFRQRLHYFNSGINRSLLQILAVEKSKLLHMTRILDKGMYAQVDSYKKRFDPNKKIRQLDQAWFNFFKMKKEGLSKVSGTLRAIDPKKLLSEGYSILFSEKTGSVIKSVQQLQIGHEIKMLLSDGEALSTIKEVIKK